MKNTTIAVILVCCLLMICLPSCTQSSRNDTLNTSSPPENVILIITDGMGVSSVSLLLDYYRYTDANLEESGIYQLINNSNISLTFTNPANNVVTDSAAAGTAIACGHKTNPGRIGVGPDDNDLTSIVDVYEGLNRSTGLISNTRITHATPAVFYASTPNRREEDVIAHQLASRADIEIIFSGGLKYFLPQTFNAEEGDLAGEIGFPISSGREDDENLIEMMTNSNYNMLYRQDMFPASYEGIEKMCGLFCSSGYPYMIDRINNPDNTVPELKTLTEAALEVLSKNENGFFLMVEAGEIDWALHANDTTALLYELIEYDRALKVALDFVESHKDTLLIITSDHETGGVGMSYNNIVNEDGSSSKDFVNTSLLSTIAGATMSFTEMMNSVKSEDVYNLTMLADLVAQELGITLPPQTYAEEFGCDDINSCQITKTVPDDFQDFYLSQDDLPSCLLSRVLSNEMGVVYSTGNHLSNCVLTFSLGAGKDNFGNLIDNTDIYNIIVNLATQP